ncbi:MAG TPA: inositol monophosphatase family protein [Geminicoccaceae bacterium]|nr:inositol monophosphatase family protein [Geminicoccus sp.]HMU50085.1 inositol monophosphatase family protein [Geminicoccaceae bacterium]
MSRAVDDRLADQIGELMRETATEVILPRFARLRDDEISEKSPGEIVTAVDRIAEGRLASRLQSLLPGSFVVGEERAAADPTIMERVDKETIWLVDPLDGTANFVAGNPRFAMMVALISTGETVRSWLLDIPADRLAVAEQGAGAFVEGRRIRPSRHCPSIIDLRGAVLTRYMPADLRAAIEPRLPATGEALPTLPCAGLDYPAVATGARHFALYWRTLPWDHAPGALLATEAGGRVARLDGNRYRPGDGRNGLLVAANPAIWDLVHATLLG